LGLCNYEPEFARKEVKLKSSGVKCESFSLESPPRNFLFECLGKAFNFNDELKGRTSKKDIKKTILLPNIIKF